MKRNKHIFLISKMLFILPFLFFGVNKFLGFADMPSPEGKTAQIFIGAMFSSYLVNLVGLTEIIGSVLLLIPRTSFLGMLILLPVTVNIAAYHLPHDLPGNGIWLFTVVMQIVVLFFFKDKFKDLLVTSN